MLRKKKSTDNTFNPKKILFDAINNFPNNLYGGADRAMAKANMINPIIQFRYSNKFRKII